MAEDKSKKRRTVKKTETVRERADKTQVEKKPRRINRTASSAAKPIKAAYKFGKREYSLPLPNNKAGRFLNKRGRLVPKFFAEAWQELRQVTWPSRQETTKMTIAVFIFALIFGTTIWIVDMGIENLFRKVLLG